MNMPNERDCWEAIGRRDAQFDGRFVYAVLTTGIYCRPSCPARTPRRENVRFFADPGAAREATYRACKRCRPDSAEGEVERLSELADYLREHADQSISLAQLAVRAQLSPAHLQRRFVALFGVSPKMMQDAERMRRMKAALQSGASVTMAMGEAGYGSSSRLYEPPARSLGMSPRAYSDGGRGELIHYAVRQTALGPLLMAATAKGVCSAQFGADADALLAQLRCEFPNAQLAPSDAAQSPQLDAWISALDAHLSVGAPSPQLPLDLRGTAFQIKVWRFLLGIGSGKAMSYSEVAAGIKQPQAVRAAASACAANRVAVLVPCHRVLRADGGLGGYRWGLERKRALLQAERGSSQP